MSTILRERKWAQTPSIEIAKDTIVSPFATRQQDSAWYVTRPAKNREKSAGGAVNIIKRQTQTPSNENRKCGKMALKEIQKLRNDWIGLQRFKCLQIKDKLNLAYFNY